MEDLVELRAAWTFPPLSMAKKKKSDVPPADWSWVENIGGNNV